ncbi:MAG: hypothetical protein N0C90_01035 [Candidatus Thiodiazotropha endolucinida]|nr:hypothetical protein [Candidatus Thiodiazotropha endolucinida]
MPGPVIPGSTVILYGRFHAVTQQEARHDIPFLFALNPYRAAMTRLMFNRYMA